MDRRKYWLLFLLRLGVFFIEFGLLLLIPVDFRPYYVLILSVLFLVEALVLPFYSSPKSSSNTILVYPLYVFLGIFLVGVSLLFVFFDLSPGTTFPWVLGSVLASSLLNIITIVQCSRIRKMIP